MGPTTTKGMKLAKVTQPTAAVEPPLKSCTNHPRANTKAQRDPVLKKPLAKSHRNCVDRMAGNRPTEFSVDFST
jgi:hypothetical protein